MHEFCVLGFAFCVLELNRGSLEREFIQSHVELVCLSYIRKVKDATLEAIES